MGQNAGGYKLEYPELTMYQMVERVAGESGFHSQLHLTRAFRRYEGTTPGAWRE